MTAPRAVVFDLGGTLVEWADWLEDNERRWGLAWNALAGAVSGVPRRDEWVRAMRAAEDAHWKRVDTEHWSGPPSGLLRDGYARLGRQVDEELLHASLDAYAGAVSGWATLVEGAPEVLRMLRARGYRLGLLSNTWWASAWHDADLAAHGMAGLLDELVYTSDLPHSKPHPAVFREVTSRLGVPPEASVMVGDRQVDDISGALASGMRAIWKRNASPFPAWQGRPSAIIDRLADIPELLRSWGGA